MSTIAGDFGTIDLNTGAFSLLGNSGKQLAGMAVANGNLYGSSYNTAVGTLYLISLNCHKMAESVAIALMLARTLLELSDPTIGDPTDPDGENRVIEHAANLLGMVRTFLTNAKLSHAEREYRMEEPTTLEAELQEVRRRKAAGSPITITPPR